MHKSDLAIAQEAKLLPIVEVAAKLGIDPAACEYYGQHIAKIDFTKTKKSNSGKLILVTAISPTPAGEGKTTTTVGLADALQARGKKVSAALREPSLGPVFGVKGGAAGGGYAQVVPMEQLNLHFTGDFHAIGAANNLLAALLDNHIHQGNALGIDPRNIIWKRCVDMNDRQLRHIVSGLHGKTNGVPREDGFDITVASEIMAVFCLSESYEDLKERLARIIVAYNYQGEPVTCGDLKAAGALSVLLKEAFKPNLVQTLEHTPIFVHGGPFANIAHGCNSVLATKLALEHSEYVVTEAGFGADLGAEKFIDIKCRLADLKPAATVLVATVRALKMHGGVAKADLQAENLEALTAGFANLRRHVSNIKEVFDLPVVVAINRFTQDTDAEIAKLKELCAEVGVDAIAVDFWGQGGQGGLELADRVIELVDQPRETMSFTYDLDLSLADKVRTIVKRIYRGDDIEITKGCLNKIKKIEQMGFGNLPICMAKTQYSFSDDQKLLGAPENFNVTIRDVRVAAGAGFVVVLTGDVMTMPGLPKQPAAEQMDLLADGSIIGLS